jgi:esterase/lipase superfamily enzyme
MFIKYFASNRDRDKLGRNLAHDKRIQLQEGGYHWLDMEKYMAYYMSTTNFQILPQDAVITESDKVVFDPFLSDPKVKRIIVCVHGFNVHLHDALTWFSVLMQSLSNTEYKNKDGLQLRNSLITDPSHPAQAELIKNNNDLTAVVGFSWPSNGNVVSYQSDRTEALSSRTALANIIARIKKNNHNAKVHIICHSMGNLLACSMFAGLINKEFEPADYPMKNYREVDDTFIKNYIMLAPDVERRHVTMCDLDDNTTDYVGPYYEGIRNMVGEAHNFYSRFDSALQFSNKEKFIREGVETIKDFFMGENPDHRYEQRLGLIEHPKVAPKNMFSHNAVALSNREIDHSDYQDCMPIAEKIAKIILD